VVVVGSLVFYTLTVHNNGPSTATNVVVADPVPAGLALVGALPSQGTFDAAANRWLVGTLPAGATATLQLAVRVLTVGPFVNTASVGAEQSDPNLANNQSSAAVVGVRLPPGQVSKRPFLSSTAADAAAIDARNRRFAAAASRRLLGQPPDPLALGYWSALLDAGVSRTRVVLAMESTPGFRAGAVERAYLRFLHHAADPDTLSALVAFLNAGGALEGVDTMLAGSAEYFEVRGGGTIAGFLEALYRDALGRRVDRRSLARWSRAMGQGLSAGQVVAAVFGSAEYERDLVKGLSQQLLHHPASPALLQTEVARLRHGATAEQVIADMLKAG
jgi:uncharacterized repeat protein (TIGR01451 family)